MIRQRLMTAVVLAAFLIGVIFVLPGDGVAVVMGLLFLGGIWEWAGFFGLPRGVRRLPLVALGAVVMGAVYWWVGIRGASAVPILVVAAAWWLVAFVWVLAYPTPIPRWAIFVTAFLVAVPAWLALWRLHVVPQLGPWWVLFAFVLVWAADTGAFFAGRAFGRHKLAPSVSPGKTWEGAVGGMLLALAVTALAAGPLGAPLPGFLALAVLVIAISVVGDLTVSLFKRGAGVKDSGQIFPGHGGILDRIDSLCAAGPVLLLGLALLGFPV